MLIKLAIRILFLKFFVLNIFITLKQAGKKRPVLQTKQISLDLLTGSFPSLGTLLKQIVEQQVREFQDRQEASSEPEFWVQQSLDKIAGKIGFSQNIEQKPIDLSAALQATLQAFEDGLIAVFHEDKQLTLLGEEVNLQENDHMVFVRLTFLAGSFW